MARNTVYKFKTTPDALSGLIKNKIDITNQTATKIYRIFQITLLRVILKMAEIKVPKQSTEIIMGASSHSLWPT